MATIHFEKPWKHGETACGKPITMQPRPKQTIWDRSPRPPAKPRKAPLTVTEDLDAITCGQCNNSYDVQSMTAAKRMTAAMAAARTRTYSVVVHNRGG